MHIEPFGVESWMDAHEDHCAHNLAESCVESLHLGELLELAGVGPEFLLDLQRLKLTYGSIQGSTPLRQQIASLYGSSEHRDVTVTLGAAGANALVYQACLERGDHVIALVPNYQQHYAIPESIGATVTRLRLRPENGWLPDLDELRRAVTPATRMITFSNPNNPTGALMDGAMLEQIAAIARPHRIRVLSDEVYRGVDQHGDGFTPSMVNVYEHAMSTGSMSKAYSLAGLRLGWIVARTEAMLPIRSHRHYNTISVGMLDDQLATLALTHRDAILARSRRLLRENLAALESWVSSEPALHWVRPQSGTTALVMYDLPMSSETFCTQLLERTGVLFVPGSTLGVKPPSASGSAIRAAHWNRGLPLVSEFLRSVAAPVAH